MMEQAHTHGLSSDFIVTDCFERSAVCRIYNHNDYKNTYTGDFITLYGVSEAQVRALDAPYEPLRDAYRVAVPNTAAATELILRHSALFTDYEITKGKMDDVFLAATGKKLTGGAEK